MPSKRKKMRQEKWKKRGGEKTKNKRNLEILLSAHARNLQAGILHLDQKPVCGKFKLFIAWQWPENHSTSFKTCFPAKSPGANGLSYASPSCLTGWWLVSKRKWSLTSCITKNIFFNATGHTYFSHATGHTSPSCYVEHLPLFCKIFFWLFYREKFNKLTKRQATTKA